MSEADKRQEGGRHYKAANPSQEHWNLVVAYGWDYFTAQVIKYMMRWEKKGGIQDLKKARHFLDKLIEIQDVGSQSGPGYVNQDPDLGPRDLPRA